MSFQPSIVTSPQMKHIKSTPPSYRSNLDLILLLGVCFLVLLKRTLMIDLEINHEEGKEIECILNIMEGKLVYRDFHWQYGPLGIYILPFIFKLLGTVNLIIPRSLVTLVAVATTFYSYRLARHFLNPKWAFWSALLASSGLVARENTYGHGFAYLGMIASFFYLLQYFKNGKTSNLHFSGGMIFLTLISKPVVFGIGAVFAAVFCLIFWHQIIDKNGFPIIPLVTLGIYSLLPAFIIYGYLTLETSPSLIVHKLFPMLSGTLNLGNKWNLKPLLPRLDIWPLTQWVKNMNFYLVDHLRWWTIILTIVAGLIYLFIRRKNWNENPKYYAIFFFLLIYGLLVESETIILSNRPITFFINMLPNYILLALLFANISRKPWIWNVKVIAFMIALFYFFYPPARLKLYYLQHGKSLGLELAKKIQVPPYTKKGYQTIVNFLNKETTSDHLILFAGYDSFIYLFSKKNFFFPEDFTTFVRTSISPFNKNNNYFDRSFFEPFEKKIVKRIQEKPPALILVPAKSLEGPQIKTSFFINYLKNNWKLKTILNKENKIGPFDKMDMQMSIFVPIS